MATFKNKLPMIDKNIIDDFLKSINAIPYDNYSIEEISVNIFDEKSNANHCITFQKFNHRTFIIHMNYERDIDMMITHSATFYGFPEKYEEYSYYHPADQNDFNFEWFTSRGELFTRI